MLGRSLRMKKKMRVAPPPPTPVTFSCSGLKKYCAEDKVSCSHSASGHAPES